VGIFGANFAPREEGADEDEDEDEGEDDEEAHDAGMITRERMDVWRAWREQRRRSGRRNGPGRRDLHDEVEDDDDRTGKATGRGERRGQRGRRRRDYQVADSEVNSEVAACKLGVKDNGAEHVELEHVAAIVDPAHG